MAVNKSDTMSWPALVVYSSTTEIVTTLSLFIVASIFEAIHDKDKKLKPSPRLHIFQLATTGLIIALSIAHAGLLAFPSIISSSETDPVVACALFIILTWVILLLPLIDRTTAATYPHYISWTALCVFDTFNTFLASSSIYYHSSTKLRLDCAVVVARLGALVVLLAVSAVIHHTHAKSEEGTPEETQPLLDVESNDASTKAADKKKDVGDDDDDEDDEAEEDDEEDESWKEDLEKLKKRTWTEYLTSFKIFLPHLKPNTKSEYFCLLVMLVCTGIVRVLNVITPLSLGWVVNSLQGATSLPWKTLGIYLGLYLINSSAGISIVQDLASVRMSMSMRVSLDIFIYNHIMNLDAKFHDSKKTATLGRITDRGDTVIDLFQEFFFDFMPTVADLLISMAVLYWMFGAYLCFIVAITGVTFAWSNTLLIKNRTSLRRKYIDAWCAVYEHAFETQYNWTTVSHFGRIEHEKNNFRTKNNKKNTREMALTIYTEVTRCTRQLIMTAGFICACVLATNQIVKGHRSVGDFVMLVSYWSQVMSPVRSIISTITSVSERLVDAEKLMLVLENEPVVKDLLDAPEFEFKGGSVDFENVNFSYDGERTVSEGITFHADAGQTIALVGETGGGKSTLLKLLFRFYDPSQGQVRIDGQDISKVKLESFRNLVGIVPQDPAMFNRTIFENVRYPNNNASEEEVIAACKAACLHDKIMTFSKQYKEKVGERGTKLSGGECQRLAIARAILKKPQMLLLDEATSAVDSVTESKIQACLKELCKGRTTFVIAHRLSTILHADQIMVIKGGKLMEMGPHKKLIRQKGAYRELWDAQLNSQLQDPGDTDDEQEGGEAPEGKKEKKKPSLFFNDMGREKIDESMLRALSEDGEDDGADNNPADGPQGDSSSKDKARSTEGDENLLNLDVGSEDVTEVESCSGAETATKDHKP